VLTWNGATLVCLRTSHSTVIHFPPPSLPLRSSSWPAARRPQNPARQSTQPPAERVMLALRAAVPRAGRPPPAPHRPHCPVCLPAPRSARPQRTQALTLMPARRTAAAAPARATRCAVRVRRQLDRSALLRGTGVRHPRPHLKRRPGHAGNMRASRSTASNARGMSAGQESSAVLTLRGMTAGPAPCRGATPGSTAMAGRTAAPARSAACKPPRGGISRPPAVSRPTAPRKTNGRALTTRNARWECGAAPQT